MSPEETMALYQEEYARYMDQYGAVQGMSHDQKGIAVMFDYLNAAVRGLVFLRCDPDTYKEVHGALEKMCEAKATVIEQLGKK